MDYSQLFKKKENRALEVDQVHEFISFSQIEC